MIMKIDRTTLDLDISVDDHEYSKSELATVLRMVDEGNKSVGGLVHIATAHCVFGFSVMLIEGFIKFLEGWYFIAVTKKSPVAIIASHYIYHIDETCLISIPHISYKPSIVDPNEQKYLTFDSKILGVIQTN